MQWFDEYSGCPTRFRVCISASCSCTTPHASPRLLSLTYYLSIFALRTTIQPTLCWMNLYALDFRRITHLIYKIYTQLGCILVALLPYLWTYSIKYICHFVITRSSPLTIPYLWKYSIKYIRHFVITRSSPPMQCASTLRLTSYTRPTRCTRCLKLSFVLPSVPSMLSCSLTVLHFFAYLSVFSLYTPYLCFVSLGRSQGVECLTFSC